MIYANADATRSNAKEKKNHTRIALGLEPRSVGSMGGSAASIASDDPAAISRTRFGETRRQTLPDKRSNVRSGYHRDRDREGGGRGKRHRALSVDQPRGETPDPWIVIDRGVAGPGRSFPQIKTRSQMQNINKCRGNKLL